MGEKRRGLLTAASVPAALLALASCPGPTGPLSDGDILLVTHGQSHMLQVVDVGQAQVVRRLGPMPSYGAYARSPDGTMLYLRARDADGEPGLVAIDLSRLTLAWWKPFVDMTQGSEIDRLEIDHGLTLTVSPDGSSLLLGVSTKSRYAGRRGDRR